MQLFCRVWVPYSPLRVLIQFTGSLSHSRHLAFSPSPCPLLSPPHAPFFARSSTRVPRRAVSVAS
eukprot:1059427-Pleurochrysis_carterae.AAC.1